MKTPHKHAELIKAWADGAKVQRKLLNGSWEDISDPSWYESNEYRIKPTIPEGFTEWNGGECPVDFDCEVEVVFRSGTKYSARRAGFYYWSHVNGEIIAYKVVKQAPVVRWQWIVNTNSANRPSLTSYFYKEGELELAYPKCTIIGKAEWTRTEFAE